MWLLLILVLCTSILLKWLNKDYNILSLCKRIRTSDGTNLSTKVYTIPGGTIFGNNFDILRMTPGDLFRYCRECKERAQGKSYLWHFILATVYNVTNAKDADEVFQSQALISKGVIYDFLHPFMGTGLLTSTDHTWQFRRKLLTPTFHFNILQTFLEVFKEESYKLVNVLGQQVNEVIPLVSVIPQFTLNNLCETALGVQLEDIAGSKEYRQSIHDIELTLVSSISNPLMFIRGFWQIFGVYKEHMRYVKIAHDFSSKIIEKKRVEFQQQRAAGVQQHIDDYGKKKRYAMLDTLFDAEAKGFIDHKGICDEVNTFMFEGYDTTSTCITFALFNLAVHPDIQQKCYEEIRGLSNMAELSVFDFNNLEYLECVLKETLRLYPSVPFVSRHCSNEIKINGLILNDNTDINIHIFDIMRDAEHFPDPLVFDPNRFLPENTVNRHPFAFVPFSAGPRNCIGQKFATLEMKVVLVAILTNFVLLPVTKMEDVIFENGLVLRTQQQVYIKLAKRIH